MRGARPTLCVIGDPVLHSKSPLIHGAMIAALGLDYEYLCKPVKREELGDFVREATRGGYAGFNATMPHKEALVPLMDWLDQDAKLYQSVNTVCIKDGKLYGYNTDGRGFIRALADEGLTVAGKRVVLLGAGGAAKAVALKLVQQGVRALIVCNRTPEKGAELCAFDRGVMSTESFDEAGLMRACVGADLLINGTSLGMGGTPGAFESLSFLDALPTHAAVCDLIYYPAETALLARGRAMGHPVTNGLGMLIHQAIFALEHFSGTQIDGGAMRRLVEQALKNGR